MEPGHTFTIEPIVMLHHSEQFYQWNDDFTVVSPNNPNGKNFDALPNNSQ